MIVLDAPAKLTITLSIEGTRADGYHLIDAEMVTLDFGDTLTLETHVAPESPAGAGSRVVMVSASGREAAGPDNLVVRALDLVGRSPAVDVLKVVPAGAGLGGGSADAAAILRWAGFTDLDAAAGLGADVPFCVVGGRARVSGVGEVVDPLPFLERTLTLLTPPVHCSTPEVYRAWDDMGSPRGQNGNDLEPAALAVAPSLASYRDELAAVSGLVPRLAGSGSTWWVPGAFPGDGRVVARTVPAGVTSGGEPQAG